MSAFTETALLKKLAELNSSQQSIQTLSLWLIHHRKHNVYIVKTWFRELQNVSEGKKLTFMYLANDVIQNSKKKGPEYGKEFANILPKVFTHIGETCRSDKLYGGLGRILNIWEERNVYDAKVIGEWRARLNREYSERDKEKNGDSTATTSKEISPKKPEKRKQEDKHKAKRPRTVVKTDKATPQQNGDVEHHSPYMPLGEAPEPEELIRALINIENSASSDVAVRERIANLPPEISEISCLAKLEDKEQAAALQKQVNEAVELLDSYNTKLSNEMNDRNKLAAMLRDFAAEQQELYEQAAKRLQEQKIKLNKMRGFQKEINDHLDNFPEVPDTNDGGLAPLPSAGDLFTK